ncbi:N-acetylornithine carbamoyltransferase [Marinoscillum sp. MHG1-6]|uniref:N-acetylornithine carbamoyltransferase n=1 Tax=Marinoscillum sp. MHG1-6 TaxID=2959627 RepID=UPI00215848FB|nr:N-acetylornithine carbamoyltransferase [Marinoscillum sp. MHG1-6]
MNQFLSVDDVKDPMALVNDAISLKKDPFAFQSLGKNKTMGMLFFNSSLRTRMSTQKAARNLGMDVLVMNVTQDSWQIETQEGAIMNSDKAEHIMEAAAVMGQYCDILGVRSFPGLKDREMDYSEHLIKSFVKYAGVPVVSLESATLHPLQSLADLITISEHWPKRKPKVVLTWAPHIKALPQAVSNSFSEWIQKMDVDFTITHPQGLELADKFTKNATLEYDQLKAFEGADFIYVKNWSSYQDYGKVIDQPEWIVDSAKMALTNDAKVMHCLPVRRNVVIADEVMDSENALMIEQANNRTYSAQVVLKELLQRL